MHGIIATNRHRAHIDPQVGEECPFCGVQETVFHLFLNCSRLQQFFHQLEDYCQIMGRFLLICFLFMDLNTAEAIIKFMCYYILYLGKENWLFGCHIKENDLVRD